MGGDNEALDPEKQQGQPAKPEPKDMAEAFKMYREQNSQVAENPVDGDGSPDDSMGDAGTDGEQGQAGESAQPADLPGEGDSGPSDGSAFDYQYTPELVDQTRKSVIEDINRQAVAMTSKQFQQAGIQKMGINDLYERNESTGQVTFHNPDDPNRPFQSRAEAQSWINSFNAQVDEEFRKAAYRNQQEIAKTESPRLQTIAFAPTYERMDDVTKSIFDDLLEGHEVRDRSGNVIGYNVDLNAAAAQAARIAGKFSKSQQQAQPQQQQVQAQQVQQSSGPALDMNGKKTNQIPGDEEPKTLEEAIRLVNKRNKEKNNG